MIVDGLINRLSNCWKQSREAPDRMRFVAYIAGASCSFDICQYIFLSKTRARTGSIQAQSEDLNWIFALFACAIMLVGGAWYVTHRSPCDRPAPIQDKFNRCRLLILHISR